ncbi:Arm DNA-binding domain-containing protein [Stenotrophomonas rhizophila]|uniref:Arm DNA-binding domain-containing protein n=1 Tax=Stenotrophomonas rhizophila TaxID=216778 RepID=UPI003CCFEFBE
MPLTDVAIRRAKPYDKPQKLADGGGLYLLITRAGAKSWRWKHRVAGKEKLLTLGLYPEVTLAMARDAREDARRLLRSGVDPGQLGRGYRTTRRRSRRGSTTTCSRPSACAGRWS